MSAAGMLIRQLRIEHNYSQAGLCRGICSTSYLSKIEQGSAEASPEILSLLFRALGVEYCRDETLISQALEQLDRWYEHWEQDAQDEAAADWLNVHWPQLRFSDLHIPVRIQQALCTETREEGLASLQELRGVFDSMEPEQQYRFLLAEAALEPDPTVILQLLQQAARRKSCAHVHLQLARTHYYMGQYSRCIETSDQAYTLAAEEGNLYVLIWSSFLLGTCYTDRDLSFAEKYYRRAIRLGKQAEPSLASMAAYNLGASYLEWEHPEQALYWLARSTHVEGAEGHNLLLEQKRVILYVHFGQMEEAFDAMRRARACFSRLQDADPDIKTAYVSMLEFAQLLLDGQEDTAVFEQVTLRLYTQAERHFGFGFRRFYGLYLVRWYRSQRRYKDALRIMEEIQERVS